MEKKNLWQTIRTAGKRREEEAFGKVRIVSVNRILPNPAQPRKHFNDEAIFKLADSIRRHGLLQPLSVRYADELPRDFGLFGLNKKEEPFYELIAGERRLRAAKSSDKIYYIEDHINRLAVDLVI